MVVGWCRFAARAWRVAATGCGRIGFDPRGDGAAYLYRRSATSWIQTEYIKAPNTDADDLTRSPRPVRST